MAAVTICTDFGAPQNKVSHCFHIYLPWSEGTKWHDTKFFECWDLSQLFPLSFFTFIKRLFSSLLSAIMVVSAAYLRLLKFLLAVLIPACASSNPAFHMMFSACKLNKQHDNIQLWCAPFLIWNQLLVLIVASWSAYRFLRRQGGWSGIPISWRISHSLLWATQSKALA